MHEIVDGTKWLNDRLRFLRDELARTADTGRREAIELEIAGVEAELATRRRQRTRWWMIGGPGPRE